MSTPAKLWSMLAPASVLFAAGTVVRNAMFDSGWRTIERTRAKVISVGGIMAGGSGKTPITLDIVRWLVFKLIPLDEWKPNDYPVVIVSRGYGRKSKGVKIVSDGTKVLVTAGEGGDEPVMMARSLLNDPRRTVFGATRGVPVIVAESRVEGVEEAERRFNAKVCVLDDAFSHRFIARDLDILIINEDLPEWWWRPLPAGRMRENLSSVKRADFIVYSGRQYNPVLRERLGELTGTPEDSATVRIERDCCKQLGGSRDGLQS
ncbi:MAG TPA: tetraacyldisaccharide 4'-kinase [Bacteroidetes bacterium]|nr:tetraacyldisaccharide 4'-kinase [Bacteroidota bacterium]HEX05079.1 tetraacyldisaccharide 4'-kinase [Bacteroidota bacterium]